MKTVTFRGCECRVKKGRYGNGRVALQLVDAVDGEPVATATVNLPGAPAGPNEVFIKDYSENEGMLAALATAGVVRPTGETVNAGFAEVPKAELLPPFRERDLEESLDGAHKTERPAPARDREWER